MDIVIVDDSPMAIALLTRLVGKLVDCTPLPFASSVLGLEWCAAHDPDLVIVDYMMPDMDGMEFTRRFRLLSGKGETPVLMVTATNDRELRHRALDLGISDFLTKPFDPIKFKALRRRFHGRARSSARGQG